jgi:hypothetical protein
MVVQTAKVTADISMAYSIRYTAFPIDLRDASLLA